MKSELTKEDKIRLTLDVLRTAIKQHKAGKMGERELMVMNTVCLRELKELDPHGAEAALERALGRLAAAEFMKLREGDRQH